MRPIEDARHGPGRLALELRRGRSRRGLTRVQLAERIGYSVSTIQRAESGDARSAWPVVRDIALACELDTGKIEAFWKEARRVHSRTGLTEAPHPGLIRTSADLAAALRRVWQENGEPSAREMERRAEGRAQEFTPLSRSAACRIRQRKQRPTSIRQMCAYLAACGVSDQALSAWKQAWLRARRHEKLADTRGTVRRGEAHLHLRAREEARSIMSNADLKPLDPYPGARRPWTAICLQCRQISRFTLNAVKNGRSCPVCVVQGAA